MAPKQQVSERCGRGKRPPAWTATRKGCWPWALGGGSYRGPCPGAWPPRKPTDPERKAVPHIPRAQGKVPPSQGGSRRTPARRTCLLRASSGWSARSPAPRVHIPPQLQRNSDNSGPIYVRIDRGKSPLVFPRLAKRALTK